MNPENVAGQLRWIQFHVVARPIPQVALSGQQILRLVTAILRNLQLIQRKRHKASLRVVRVKIDHGQNQI